MKNQIYISQKWKKWTAVFLLLNFFIAPLLCAFPQEECNGVCEMSSVIHECSSEENIPVEMSCCDTMDMNIDSKTTTCGMELSDIDCALVIHGQANTTYIIPKTIHNEVEFVQITIIDFQTDNSKVDLCKLTHDFSYKNKPPIYLTVSSFLI